MKVRLTETQVDFSGTRYPAGMVVDTFVEDGEVHVKGAQSLPLNFWGWWPVVSDEDLMLVLSEGDDPSDC